MNNRIFKRGVGELSLVFGVEIDDARTQLYWENLRDLRNEDFAKAVKFLIQNNKFFPAIAEIRQVATGQESESISAWQKLVDALREVGWYRSPHFDDPVIWECIKTLGGWKLLCDRKLDGFFQKDFERIYNILRQREDIKKIQLPPVENKKLDK